MHRRMTSAFLVFLLWSAAVLVPALQAADSKNFNSRDEIFLKEAVMEQLFILRAAKLAGIRSEDAPVQDFGKKLVKTVGEWNKRIETLIRKNQVREKMVELPGDLDAEHHDRIDKLQKAKENEFNAKFLESMQESFHHLTDTYEEEARYGGNEQVRKFAENTISEIRILKTPVKGFSR